MSGELHSDKYSKQHHIRAVCRFKDRNETVESSLKYYSGNCKDADARGGG